MTTVNPLGTAGQPSPRAGRRPHLVMALVATVATAAVLALPASAPDNSGVAAAGVEPSGDVLFWSRSTNSGAPTYEEGPPFSILKTSAATPSLVATVLTGTYYPASASYGYPEGGG